jgi:hypothetical protein
MPPRIGDVLRETAQRDGCDGERICCGLQHCQTRKREVGENGGSEVRLVSSDSRVKSWIFVDCVLDPKANLLDS